MDTATIATQLAPALSSYAQRLHANAGGGNHIVSPLGAWMLLALCARGSDGRLRDELTTTLGMDVDQAALVVAALLEKPHPAVALGAGIWTSRELHAEDVARWLAGLPVPVGRGEIPSKAALDEWTAKQTRGLIREFPVQLSPLTALVLATTLATKVGWMKPFRSVPARELDVGEASDWSRQVQRVLRTPSPAGHMQLIARTERAGDVCVHTALAREDLAVTSVIADHRVPATDVMATAYDLAVAVTSGRPVATRSLFDLPLGDSPLWTISQEEALVSARSDREEIFTTVLPAWSGEATHDLRRDDLGFPAAAAWLAQLTRSDALYDYEAKQSVVARYNRMGFEAAAVSALAFTRMAMDWRQERGLRRRATLRFGHPFAVVAVASGWTGWGRDASSRIAAAELWPGLPVYSAWVTVPAEADEDRDEELFDVDNETLQEERARFVESRSAAPLLGDAADRTPRTPWSRAMDWIRRL